MTDISLLPPELRQARAWLVWRYVQVAGEKKPRKMPFYCSGNPRGWPNGRPRDGVSTAAQPQVVQGDPLDLAQLTTLDEAQAVCAARGLSGVGLAMRADLGLVALDFDDCVTRDFFGQVIVDPRVAALVSGTYAEFSPSGSGLRAFFRGSLRDGKDNAGDPKVEFFHDKGFVTITGNALPAVREWCAAWGDSFIAELSQDVKQMHDERIESRLASGAGFFAGSAAAGSVPGMGSSAAAGGVVGSVPGAVNALTLPGIDALVAVQSKVGWSLDDARDALRDVDPGADRSVWLNALMALHHEFDGSEAALELADEWSSGRLGGLTVENYSGRRDIEARWRSFGRRQGGNPITARWLIKWRNDSGLDNRRGVIEEIKGLLALAEDTTALTTTVAKKIKALMPDDAAVRAEVIALFSKRFRSIGSVALPISEIRALLLDKPPPTIKTKRPLTEFGNAERMLDKFGQSMMYVPELGAWFLWTGVYWRRAADVEIEHLAKESIKSLVNEYDDHEQEAAEFFEFCRLSQQARMVANMVRLASSDPRVVVPAEELDKHARLLGVRNGVVDLQTGVLLPPDPALRITKVCGCNYNPAAGCGLWKQTVLDVFSGDQELVDYFQRVIGYVAMGRPTEDIMVIPFGNGSNGKSTVFGAIRSVLGTYAKSADASTFVQDARGGGGSAGGAREDLLRLRGARFVYVSEPDENSELREGSVKSMTGGDSIPARGVYAKESVEINPTWTVFMATNHKPIVKGNDNGIWRRLVLIPFERNFENDPNLVKDVTRNEKLALEAEGVLAWIIAGTAQYMRRGLGAPEKIRKARDTYRSQMDLLSEWIEECCQEGGEFWAPMEVLWRSWESYAKQRGILHYVRSSIALGRRLDQRFPSAKREGKRVRVGLRIAAIDPFNEFFKS